MSSGRRQSVVIFCVSAFDRLYLAPIRHYDPDSVHVFVGIRDDILSSLEREMYASSKERILCDDVTEHHVDTSDYNEILGKMIEILKGLDAEYGEDLDVFINISSGTPEFSAAGLFVSMLSKQATSFRVDAECKMSRDEMTKIISTLNEHMSVLKPERVTGLKNDSPDEEMVAFLKVVSDILLITKYPKYRLIIEKLKEEGAWSYDPGKKSGYGRTSLEEKEERYLKRHYIATALEKQWLERPTQNTMKITDSGKAYISVYTQNMKVRSIGHANTPIFEERSEPMSELGTHYDGYNQDMEDRRLDDVYYTGCTDYCSDKYDGNDIDFRDLDDEEIDRRLLEARRELDRYGGVSDKLLLKKPTPSSDDSDDLNTVRVSDGENVYTFTIGMDQHR
ncbi:MAG: hypothetical protein IJ856_04005 [Candidatus Methanomethylophilaceae archaeon]|nr:hypothetical protein [Candidatus Methanomethylophilaceae archaeon]